MASLTPLCPHCKAQVPFTAGPTAPCPSCGKPVNGSPCFYAKNGQKIGPVSVAHLQQLADSGQLQRTDMVLQDGTQKWVTAGSIPSLFPAATEGPVPTSGSLPPDPLLHEIRQVCGEKQVTTSEVLTQTHLPQPTISAEVPQRIGRYRVLRLLGKGGFGAVYLGHDDELHRQVAIKVPLRERVSKPEDAEAYLAEARTVAGLDHPHIVPVFDVGRSEDGLCFVVSKFIEGSDLAHKIKEARLSFTESAALVAVIAEALHHAHCRRLTHRDVKPANILLDSRDQPYLADFGLALKEGDVGKEGAILGSPAYMSPEQARGEGHRVDGRSDIFSLGVVLYELLTGQRPFVGESTLDLLMRIVMDEPPAPRQVDDTIPTELERICLKALAKRASERYTTALDLADDLRHWQSRKVLVPSGSPSPLKIIPKGLRSFDANDADFFLELLPGPRDRDDLPDSLRFWKSRIEEKDADKTFSVGLLYGPSGCGKSSLVKAGLLPRLADSVISVYIEATGEETEARLLKGLRKKCPGLRADLGLPETLALLRRGQGIPLEKKVLLVIDQFEQWLHARKQDRELVQGLRQCDGERVQAVLMVRDDFWMAATRFLADLEINLLQGQNSAAVDLFDLPHAKKVLTAFGRAFGPLPDALTKEQDAFLDQAVAGLAQDDKIISVRLALFAEMVKGKPWTPATLQAVGGTEGVGVTFLEETFVALSAPPRHRLHQKAAQGVLKALLPEASTDIKGHMKSRQALLEASGYADRPAAFEGLLRLLDSELRLITPTDAEAAAGHSISEGNQFYQLTHDYLVHSLRDWLTRKQKETKRGRAELLLADRAAVWNARPENRQLPSLLQWLQIRRLTQKQHWTPSQQKMMKQASRYHKVRGVIVVAVLLVATLTGLSIRSGYEAKVADGLVSQVIKADTAQVPGIVQNMEKYRTWTDPMLRKEFDKAREGSVEKLHVSLALLPVDPSQVNYLYERLLLAEPSELAVIRDALWKQRTERESLTKQLWGLLADPRHNADQRFRAACALATYDADGNGGKWSDVSGFVVDRLLLAVQNNPSHYPPLLDALRPIRGRLSKSLTTVYRLRERSEAERSLAASILADYVSDQPDLLADLLLDADTKQFATLYPKVEAHRDRAVAVFRKTVGLSVDALKRDHEKERLAKHQANAAVALLRLKKTAPVWPLLRHRHDPRTRSYLIHRISPMGADAKAIIKRLDEEKEVSIRRALILSLGEFDLSVAHRDSLIPRLLHLYDEDVDPGIHSAAKWVLRRWGQQEKLDDIDKKLATGKVEGKRDWYITRQGQRAADHQTMVVIRGPVEFIIGSPPDEEGREGGSEGKNETQQKKRIPRSFAIASMEVTVEQFLRILKGKPFDYGKQYAPTGDCPMNAVSWYHAAAYCNFLSELEGIPKDQWCYEPTARGYGEGMKAKPMYLSLQGYRLPTEAEWEYAARAGAITSRFFGETEELLGKYAWYLKTSPDRSRPVGGLKPNDLGLFDMLGNAAELCHDEAALYQPGDDVEKPGEILDRSMRIVRGGAFGDPPMTVRSALRNRVAASLRNSYLGFRPARTIR